jgi:ankyrin repeat protein
MLNEDSDIMNENLSSETLSKGIKQFLTAAEQGDLSKIQSMIANIPVDSIDPDDPLENTALHLASENGHANVVTWLLNSGADINKRRQDTHKRTSLHLAAANNHANVVEALIEHGCEINTVGTAGMTALYRASTHNAINATRLLLLYGADIHKTDNLLGMTALQSAIVNKNTDIVKLLTFYSCFSVYICFETIELLANCIKENYTKYKTNASSQLHEYITCEAKIAIVLFWENNRENIKNELQKLLLNNEDIDLNLNALREFLLECIIFRVSRKLKKE